MKYKIAKDVFLRKYDDTTILYQTSKQNMYILNGFSYELINHFKTYTDFEICFNEMSSVYTELNDKTIRANIVEFLEELIQKGILQEDNILIEKKDSMEMYFKNQLLPIGQLYHVMFELTYRCNEKCKHCYCVNQEGKNELTFSEIKRIINDLYDMNVFELTFTGGDLFVRKDAFEILQYAYSKNFLINIFTNGIALSDDDIFKIKAINPKSIHFSLYSSVADKHDSFTQVPNSFNKTIKAIKKCVALGIPVNIKTCVLDYNETEIEDILELTKSLGATIQISMSINAKNNGDKAPTKYRLNDIKRYANIMKKVNKHVLIHCSNNFDMIRDDLNRICGAGYNSICINPYGDVYPCNALLINCGNLREKNILKIWNESETLEKIRAFSMDKVEGCCDCENALFCNFCPGSALTETGNPLKKYSEACLLTEAKKFLERSENENEI